LLQADINARWKERIIFRRAPIVEAERAVPAPARDLVLETAHHESGHAICALASGDDVESIIVDLSGRSGLCRRIAASWPDGVVPKPLDERVIHLAGIYGAGAIATRRFVGAVYNRLETAADFRALAASGDYDTFTRGIGFLCNDDPIKLDAVRTAAIGWAETTLNQYWGAVTALAYELAAVHWLSTEGVKQAIRRAPSGKILLRETTVHHRGEDGPRRS
jgi:hypothetical protein